MAELQESVRLAVHGNEILGYKSYKELIKVEKGNVLLCPLSAETILALTYMGAAGKTAKEMAQTLVLPEDIAVTADGFSQLSATLSKSTEVTLNIANKIFVDNRFELKESFKKIASEKFLAGAENVDFLKKSAECLKLINDWVAGKTNDKIQNLLSELDPDTVMVLINAIYFNGNWKKQFNVSPVPLQFRVSEKDSFDVPSIQVKSNFGYYDDDELDAQILELPYEGDEYSFVIILPRKIDGITELEQKLPISFADKLRICEVNVTIPKFKLEKTIEFTDILKTLGMGTAFSNAADFSGMGSDKLKISQVIQKTFIDVNEKGTEAAAATAVIMMIRCAMVFEEPEQFFADHPFLFVLQHKLTGVILFVGRYCNPIV